MRMTTHNVDYCMCEQCHQWRLESRLADIKHDTAQLLAMARHSDRPLRMTHWERRRLGRAR